MDRSVDRVRVGIVTWQSADVLADCLAALPQALDGLAHDVVVVDNASTDGSAELAARAGATVIRNTTNRGYARAMNQALAGTDAPWVVALNPDTIPSPGALAELVADLAAHPRCAVAAPLLVHPDGVVQHSVHRFPSLRLAALAALVPATMVPRRVRDHWWLHGAVRADRTGRVDWAIGAVHAMRTDAVMPLGPYDERWFLYVEDLDLCWRLAEHGWQIRFVGEVAVTHVGDSAGDLAHAGGSRLRWLRESYGWYGRQHGPLAVRLYALLNLVGELRVRLRRRLSGRLRGPVCSAAVRLHARTSLRPGR